MRIIQKQNACVRFVNYSGTYSNENMLLRKERYEQVHSQEGKDIQNVSNEAN